jgi:surface carbohydrate biosynthesis protein
MNKLTKKIKIAIIVDNPSRDLLALRDIAVKLVSKFVTVDLVPMYFCKPYMLGELPNLIIFNYARSNNSHLISLAKRLNIKTSVLDTEGGVWVDLGIFVNIVKSSNAPCLDLYMTWGEHQKVALNEVNPKIAEKFSVTGHPRFDRNIKMGIKRPDNAYVLINTNFPALFPKYEDFISEFKIAKNSGALSLELASEFFRNATITYGRFIEFIFRLIDAMPETKFLIRAHPFENDERYRVIFLNSKNVTISSSGDVFDALKESFCLIHFDCTTAIEAHLGRLPVGSIEACNFGQRRQLLPKILSEELFTIDSAMAFINKSKKENSVAQKKCRFDGVLQDYFGPLDGLAANRIAEAVLSIAMTSGNGAIQEGIKAKEILVSLLYKFFKLVPFYYLILIRGGSKKRIAEKSFNSSDLIAVGCAEFQLQDISNSLTRFFKAPTSVRISWLKQ